MINVAFIGCGAIFKNHANAIKNIEGLYLYAVCDIDEFAAKEGAKAIDLITTIYRSSAMGRTIRSNSK